ncbi:MAG TPA: HAD hydrolase-like protein [Candidatus Treponema faecavium]|nr:HAD hydrolase-like protein [Candidatus Treponema faecavium]
MKPICSWLSGLSGVLFDFDGVLIDSGSDIAASVNALLGTQGFAPLSKEQIVSFVGNGAKKLLERAFAAALSVPGAPPHDAADFKDGSERFASLFSWYVSYYTAHCAEQTVLYPGAETLLRALSDKGIALGVVSNKPLAVSCAILSELHIDRYFMAVVGPEQLSRIKPDPEGLILAYSYINHARAQRGLAALVPEQLLMVGDSRTDIEAGQAFGCRTCAVTGGLGSTRELLSLPADITVRYAGDLRELL